MHAINILKTPFRLSDQSMVTQNIIEYRTYVDLDPLPLPRARSASANTLPHVGLAASLSFSLSANNSPPLNIWQQPWSCSPFTKICQPLRFFRHPFPINLRLTSFTQTPFVNNLLFLGYLSAPSSLALGLYRILPFWPLSVIFSAYIFSLFSSTNIFLPFSLCPLSLCPLSPSPSLPLGFSPSLSLGFCQQPYKLPNLNRWPHCGNMACY